MAKPILLRKSFNAGELSPELHYRDDLAAHAKGCKHLTNMVPTPYGAVTRRPPLELMAKINTNLYGIPVRYIPFKFSLTEVFHIVFTDGSGSQSPDPTTADVIIFNSDGSQVAFEGEFAIATTVYDPADLDEIHFINVNDFVYLTCGGKYPVQIINRFFDIQEGGNRWKIEDASFRCVPFLDTNTNTGDTISTHIEVYDAATTYETGDVVFGVTGGTSTTRVDWSNTSGTIIPLVYFNAAGWNDGDRIYIDGISLSGGSQATFTGTNTPATGDVSGAYSITNTNPYNTWVGISLYVTIASGGTVPTINLNNAKIWKEEDYGGLKISMQDGNTGQSLTDTLYWQDRDRYSGSITVTSISDIFNATDVDRLIQLETVNVKGTSGDWTSNDVSFPIIGGSLVELTTSGGAWGGKLALQESKDGGLTYEEIGTIESTDGSYNGSIERNIAEPSSLIRVKMTEYANPHTNYSKKSCSWQLKTPNGAKEIYKITAFTNSKTVTVMPITPIDRSRTDYRWSLGAFSDTSGYPFSLTIHDERLVLGGCKTKPNTVYASRVNEWDNFLTGFQETSPYEFTVASDNFDTIRSLKSSRQLNVLTDNQEVTMGSRDDNAITSVTNISVSSHTNYGSNNTQAVQMADMIWFAMGQGRRVRASRYDFASDGQQSIEMSLFASHITESGIKEMSFRRHPFNSLFCTLNNGTACVLTYEGMQEVKAWATVSTVGGNIISASANYSDEGDIVAGVVERGGSYFLESLGSIDDDTVFLDNSTNWFDEDFTIGVAIEQDDDGNLVVIHDDEELVDGVDYSITSGILQIPTVTTGQVTVGRKYVSRVNPTDPAEVTPAGQVKRLTALGLYLLDSGACKVAINGDNAQFSAGLKWVAGQRESGQFDLDTGGDWDQGLDVNITIDSHRHFTLLGLAYRLSISQG